MQTYLPDPAIITMEGILTFSSIFVLFPLIFLPLYALGVDKKQIIRVDMERPSLQIIKRYEWCSEEKKDRNLPKCQIFMDFDKIKKKGLLKKWKKEFVRVGLQDMLIKPVSGEPLNLRNKNNSELAAKPLKASVCHPSSNNWEKHDYIDNVIRNFMLSWKFEPSHPLCKKSTINMYNPDNFKETDWKGWIEVY